MCWKWLGATTLIFFPRAKIQLFDTSTFVSVIQQLVLLWVAEMLFKLTWESFKTLLHHLHADSLNQTPLKMSHNQMFDGLSTKIHKSQVTTHCLSWITEFFCKIRHAVSTWYCTINEAQCPFSLNAVSSHIVLFWISRMGV